MSAARSCITSMPAPSPTGAVVLSPDDGLRLPYWLFNFEELAEIVLGTERSDMERAKSLRRPCCAKQSNFNKAGLDKVGSVDTPFPTACRMRWRILTGRWAR